MENYNRISEAAKKKKKKPRMDALRSQLNRHTHNLRVLAEQSNWTVQEGFNNVMEILSKQERFLH